MALCHAVSALGEADVPQLPCPVAATDRGRGSMRSQPAVSGHGAGKRTDLFVETVRQIPGSL